MVQKESIVGFSPNKVPMNKCESYTHTTYKKKEKKKKKAFPFLPNAPQDFARSA